MLAPMAGYTDVAFRVLCRRQGASLVCTEMVHAQALLHGNAKTLAMTKMLDEERPVGVQLFGGEPEKAAASCRRVQETCDAISFNLGCPADRIKASGCGAALLDDPARIVAIIEALRSSTEKPLIPKMRLGNMTRIDVVALAERIEAAGADALIVHGRTAKQGYGGKADWKAIGLVKNALSIPVIANGDVIDGPSANECLKVTKADGLAIGRAALGDPAVFCRIATYLKDGTVLPPPSPAEKRASWQEYLGSAQAAGLPAAAIKQQAMVFTRGLPGAAKLREEMAKGASRF